MLVKLNLGMQFMLIYAQIDLFNTHAMHIPGILPRVRDRVDTVPKMQYWFKVSLLLWWFQFTQSELIAPELPDQG